MAMNYVMLFTTFLDEIEPLSMEERGKLLTAILLYASGRPVPQTLLDGDARLLFPVCRGRIDRDVAAYNRKVEINRLNGAKGGRPRKTPAG